MYTIILLYKLSNPIHTHVPTPINKNKIWSTQYWQNENNVRNIVSRTILKVSKTVTINWNVILDSI